MTAPVSQGSIRRRLVTLLLCGAAALAILLYFVVQSVARQVAQESKDNVLAASALSIMDSARSVGGVVTLDLPYFALSMLDTVSDERVFYAVHLGDELLTGYGALPRVENSDTGLASFASASFLGEDIRIASVQRPITTDIGQSYIEVSVAQTLAGQNQKLAQISRTSLAIGAGFFLLCAILAIIVARSTIKPLDRLTISVSRRGPKELRPVAAPVPREMVPLVASLNSFMARLQTSLTRSEEFIAEAAHRVRTPLAIVRTKAEIIQRRVSDPENRKAIREMIHTIDESSRTAGQLLDHAMVTFRLDHLADEEIDLAQLIEDTVERSRPLSEIKDIDLIVTELAPHSLRGDPILLQNAMLNLIDNALKYCPAEATVQVQLKHEDNGALLTVRDNGPGFPSNTQDLKQRFARGPGTDAIVGSGLGLTIVEEVIIAHGGAMNIGNAKDGGACVSLSFP